VLSYGFDDGADYRIHGLERDGLVTRFKVTRPAGLSVLSVTLNLPGVHNVLNATAAIAVASDEGVDDDAIVRGLRDFSGVNRRFSRLGALQFSGGSAELVDDYGHHPTEVRATLDAVRQAWPERRVVMIYQPHRFSRTRDLYEDFVAVLSRCDVLILLDVYPAGEDPIPGADSRSLTRSIRQRGQVEPIFVETPEEVPQVLADVLRDGDVVVAQGAGNIGRLAQTLAGLASLEARS
jgi:UDP-N-acetylmuramate--alanine ligase